MATISRQEYNNLFGPTVGDKIRLGDTDLYVEIEKDLREYGDEVVYGGLLGSAPIMPVHTASAADFIARGGRIPAPMQSLKN